LIEFIDKVDLKVSEFILENIKNPKLDRFLSKVNRGEIFFLVFLISCYLKEISWKEFGLLFIHVGSVTFFTDRFILLIKKKISRKRPLIRVMEKKDSNPDMRHSFPSAHAANSMISISLMILFYNFPFYLLCFSLFAGIGRLLSLHHFLSDVIGGWSIGFSICILNFIVFKIFF
jgi:membrane-associated phospholipid phosphatase